MDTLQFLNVLLILWHSNVTTVFSTWAGNAEAIYFINLTWLVLALSDNHRIMTHNKLKHLDVSREQLPERVL